MITDKLFTISEILGEALRRQHFKITTVESCTGGGIAVAITEIAGSSDYFDFGFVTYSNTAKQKLVGVRAKTLADYGAVSEQVVAEMATGAIKQTNADIAISVSGVAGPTGGTPEKPAGTVCFGFAFNHTNQKISSLLASHSDHVFLIDHISFVTKMVRFAGNRTEIRDQASLFALKYCLNQINSNLPIDTV